MANIIRPMVKKVDIFGKPIIQLKKVEDFSYLLNIIVSDIIPFDNGTEELILSGATILPRHYYIFVGTKNNEIQFKPYEYDSYRIVVTTVKDHIVSIDSIG